MRKLLFGSFLLATILLAGCSTAPAQNATSNNPEPTSPSVIKSTIVHLSALKNPSENYGETVHKGTGKLPALAYSGTLGFLGQNQAIQPLSKTKVKVGFGTVVQFNNNKTLPQPSPIPGYEPDYITSNDDFVCYIYQSSGIGQNVGEIVYAFNIKTGISTELWRPTSGTNEQLMEFKLDGNNLYFGVQSSNGNKALTRIHQVDLNTMNQKVILTSMGSGTDKIVEDFAVSNGVIGIIWTPATHFIANLNSNGNEPYTFTIGALDGTKQTVVYHGTNPNAFDMEAKNGLWVWSDKTNGVECYSAAQNKTWNISASPSYVETDGVCVWWRAIDSKECGGFDTRTQKFVKLSGINAPFSPIVSDGRVILITGINSYYWTTSKNLTI